MYKERVGRLDTRILLIEDDELVAQVTRATLRDLGQVTWAESAERALELIPEGGWSLLVIDVELPGMSGLEFLQTARERVPAAAALVISGHASFDYAVQAMRLGADDYVTKPVDAEDLLDKVRGLLAMHEERPASPDDRVLAIGAHPDDVEIGCGGILLRHRAAGSPLAVVTLTFGEAGGEPERRRLEAQHAAELMSAQLYSLELTDTTLTDGGPTIRALEEVVQEFEPTTIYTHTPRDAHQDHRSAHNATVVAARGVARVYAYQSPSTSVEYQPTRFISIDRHIERKLEVINAYKSQVELRHYLDEELLVATARYWSRWARCRYAEPLEVVRETQIAAAEPSSGLGTSRDAG